MTSRMTACLRAFMFSEYTKPLTDYACECINILLGDRRERMPIAAPDKKTAPATGRQAATGEPATRVAVAGATGYAGQELVRLLARHPAVRLTAAMSSGATSAPRPLPQGTIYGLPERDAAAIKDARLVSCPGCYPTAALLALQPLADAGLIEGTVIVDAKSGISGAGKAPSDRTHFSENYGSVAAYAVFSHRHHAEIEQELKRDVTFVPHLVPLDRGILETIYVATRPGTTEGKVAETLQEAYRDAPFVRLTGAALPEIKHVAHTNFCDIGWKVDEGRGRLALIAVLDNLLKGAAGQ